ncbi:hypothetical protein F6X40_27480 [Paraburkholderia sp. UCT31]|uniref:hypothetical protein n=1 Tax=Paraburkholderia sp. UCT31 TaxID=2615209 RepID=UPI00165596F3|nr:hypothetical protein [Paraburkholderia sp. UCT31]MBC8740403.1 hypothetical protein [Paraburkholderia sp. UCT31]
MQLQMSQQEREDLIIGLQMRIAVIETGDPVLRANDAINSGKHKMVKALSQEQRTLIARHETLVTKLLQCR